ncbi:MAG TPA: hypothetical protein VN577_22020 [Terriglobales bacterium]|nr:hypothetical protein [Terriglobales bacterium]
MHELWNRDELYKEVWAEPVQRVAARYGVSGNAIAKVCRKMNIPVPGRGYWAKKDSGQHVTQRPLPPMKNVPQLWKPEPQPKTPPPPPDPEFDEIDRRMAAGDFEPPATRTKRHPLVERAKELLSSSTGENNFRRLHVYGQDTLNIRVSKAVLPRALNLFNSLSDVAERIGGSVRLTTRWSNKVTVFAAAGGEAELRIREKLTMVKNMDKARWSGGHYNSFEPAGILILEITAYSSGLKTEWKDKPNLPLESQIPAIIATLIKVCVIHRRRVEEEERKELARRKREMELEELAKLISVEEARVNALLTDVENWQRARGIRDYVAALETLDGEAQSKPGFLEWAKDQADRLDPLTPSPSSILDRRSEVSH